MSTNGPKNPRIVRDVSGLEQWLRSAVPGSWAAYHDGFLLLDREPTPLRHFAARQLRALADAAREAQSRGEVFLLQQRLEPGCFRYFVVRRAPRPVKPVRVVAPGAMGSGRFTRGEHECVAH